MRKALRWAVRASTSPAPTAPGYDYGYWWWLEPGGGAYMARGNLGQFVFVDPRHDVVVARFGTDDGDVDWPAVFAEVADSVASNRAGAAP